MRTAETFFERVWSVAAKVPRGKVTTYGAIARALGSPRRCQDGRLGDEGGARRIQIAVSPGGQHKGRPVS